MKKKVLLSSIATIALCLCLIAGSTFALFTDSTNFNIAVTAGDVEILSTAEVVATYSANGPVNEHDDVYLKDENGAYYEHQAQTPGQFINGGTAIVENGGTLVVNRLTPGDKVDVKINTQNLGDVAFRYRYTIKIANDNGLAKGMVLTTHSSEEYEAVKSFTSEWFPVVEAGDTTTDLSKVISLELPVYAGNEYQSEAEGRTLETDGLPGTKSVEYTILVEAVQGNAVTTENETFVDLLTPPTQNQVQLALNNEGTVDLGGQTLGLEEALEAFGKDATFKNATIDATNAAPYGEPQLALYLQQADLTLEEGATIISGADYGIFGMYVNSVTLAEGSKIIVPDGSVAIWLQVMGDTFDLTFGAQGLIVDENGAACTEKVISVTSAGTFNFYVPSVAAYDEYSQMISYDTTAQDVNWYVGDVLYMHNGVLVTA